MLAYIFIVLSLLITPVYADISATNATLIQTLLNFTSSNSQYDHFADQKVNSLDSTVIIKGSTAPTPTSPPPSNNWGLLSNGLRDKTKWPFATNTAVNKPIGSGAAYAAANIKNIGTAFIQDQDIIMLSNSYGNTTYPVYKISGFPWPGGSMRCNDTGEVIDNIPWPQSWVLPAGGENNSLAILMPDGKTIRHNQPITHCNANGKLTSWDTKPSIDIYGTDMRGSHGGSGLGGAAFAIKRGEFTSGSIHHAMGVNLDAAKYYSSNCSWSWPATQVDGYCSGRYGGSNQYFRPGALLALKPDFNINGLRTTPGKIFAKAFQDYGAYVGDDTSWNSWAIWTAQDEGGSVVNEFKQLYNFDMRHLSGSTHPFYYDMVDIFQALHIITNNSSTNIGGGGTPRVSLPPAIGN